MWEDGGEREGEATGSCFKMYPGFWVYADMARPIDPEMIATEKTVCYLQFLPCHMGPHREAPGS